MNIQETTDYDLFKSITSNREVDQKHVNRLVKAIQKKNLLKVNPITVNSKMEVIDGQHRLEAATTLGVPVYFLVDDEISKEDIATINSNAKNWSVLDYINYWTIEKRPGFDKLSAFLSEHPLIPPSTALMMMSSDGKRDMPSLREGVVDTSGYDSALHIAGVLRYFRNLIEFAYDRNFILAVVKVVNTPGYDHEIMKTKLEFQSRSLVKCINRKQYVEMLEEIYNYHSSKNRLKFT